MDTTLGTSHTAVVTRRRRNAGLIAGLSIATSVVVAAVATSNPRPEAIPLTTTPVAVPQAPIERAPEQSNALVADAVALSTIANFPPYLIAQAQLELEAVDATRQTIANFPLYLLTQAQLELKADDISTATLANFPPYLIAPALLELHADSQTTACGRLVISSLQSCRICRSSSMS